MVSADYVWVKVYSLLEQRLGSVTVSAWLDDAEVTDYSETALVMYSPSEFRREMIQSKLAPYIEDALKELFGSDAKLQVLSEKKEPLKLPPPAGLGMTFDSFVPGPTNQLAYSAAQFVSREPGKIYNPLVLYGMPGVGKTHLLRSIAASCREHDPKAQIVLARSEDFVNELISSILDGNNKHFREKYRNCDMLLVDDIQFLAGKEATQEELFNTFNTLYENGKQIVLTSDRAPGAIATLEDRIRSRLEGGLTVSIQPPDLQTSAEIVRRKAAQLDLNISNGQCKLIAEKVNGNVRQLEGIVKKLHACRALAGMELDSEQIETILGEYRMPDEAAVPSPEQIIRCVCRYFSLAEADLWGTAKSRSIVEARQTAIYLIRMVSRRSMVDIGKLFRRDHTTILHAIRVAEEKCRNENGSFAENLKAIQSSLTQSSAF